MSKQQATVTCHHSIESVSLFRPHSHLTVFLTASTLSMCLLKMCFLTNSGPLNFLPLRGHKYLLSDNFWVFFSTKRSASVRARVKETTQVGYIMAKKHQTGFTSIPASPPPPNPSLTPATQSQPHPATQSLPHPCHPITASPPPPNPSLTPATQSQPHPRHPIPASPPPPNHSLTPATQSLPHPRHPIPASPPPPNPSLTPATQSQPHPCHPTPAKFG